MPPRTTVARRIVGELNKRLTEVLGKAPVSPELLGGASPTA